MTRIQAEGPSRPASQALWQSPRVLVFDRYFSNKSMFCVCVWMHNISKCKWMPFKQHSMRVSGKLFACCHCNVCVYHIHVCHMFSCIVFPWCRLVISFFSNVQSKNPPASISAISVFFGIAKFKRVSNQTQILYNEWHDIWTMHDIARHPCARANPIGVSSNNCDTEIVSPRGWINFFVLK